MKPPSRCFKKAVHIHTIGGERVAFCDTCWNRAVRGALKGGKVAPGD